MARPSIVPALLLTTVLPFGCAIGEPESRATPANETALAAGATTWLDRTIAPEEAQNPGKSAFRLVGEGHEAFVIRSRSAQLAMRSLDVQTFIWRDDLTGRFLAHRLLEAADRGVRVRILVDGIGARDSMHALAALAAHDHVSVRVFNPLGRGKGARQLPNILLNLDGLNRRMHNKTWVADNRVAVVGGRNIGDEYYGASDTVNFVDLDLVMFGPIVRDISASFDDYWTSPSVVSVEQLPGSDANERALATQRLSLDAAATAVWRSHYAAALLADDTVQQLVSGRWPMQWSARHIFVADDPLKAMRDNSDLRRAAVRRMLIAQVNDLKSDLLLVSPYFVPGDDTTTLLTQAATAGKRVRLLTNSLVATDMSAVHGVYARHREVLLARGVQIWELKARPERKASESAERAAALHTKALLIDRRKLFVGSYNLDPRSAWINCEQGVLIEDANLASEMESIFAAQINGSRAWRVTLSDGELRWSDGASTFVNDPYSSIGQRLLAWLTGVLRLDAHF